jgi:vanillate monooxygenase ferredoxin subunit
MDDGEWLDVTVARKWPEAVGVAGFELVAAGGGLLPGFEAGAFIDVLVPSGLLRPYSLCNAPTQRERYVIAVLREPRGRGASIELHDRVRQGDRLRIRAPRNEFQLHAAATYSVLLAAGIGVTPMLGMVDALWRRGAGFELHYSARNADRAAFVDRLRCSSAASRVNFHWSEAQGRLDFTRVLSRAPTLSHLYVCGPGAFIDAAFTAASRLGWASERLHAETFGARPRLTAPPTPRQQAPGAP